MTGRFSNAEMKSQIPLRHDARSAVDFIHLRMISREHAHPRSNRRAIAFGPDELELDPVLLVATVIAQKRRHIIHIQNQRIDIAVIVVIAKRRAAAGETLADTRSHLRGDILETALRPDSCKPVADS